MNKKLLLILVLALLLHLTVFSYVTQFLQTAFWDESENLLLGKSIAWTFMGKTLPTQEGIAPHREWGISMFYAPFFLLFGNEGVETVIRFVLMLVAVCGVYFAYIAVNEMFKGDKHQERYALLSAFGMAIQWTYLFFAPRFTMYIIAPFLFFLAVYFWWKYWNTKKLRYLVVSFLIQGLGMIIYYSTAFLVLIIGMYLISINRRFYTDKNLWIAGGITLLALMPYFIYSQITYGAPIPRLSAVVAAGSYGEGGIQYLGGYIPVVASMLTLPFLVLFFIGLAVLYPVWLSLDIILKGKDEQKSKWLFVIYWLLVVFVLYSISAYRQGVIYDAYLLIMFPALFLVCGAAVSFFYDLLESKVHRIAAVGFLLIFLLLGIFFQYNMALSTIDGKARSFSEIQQAGYDLKIMTKPDEVSVSASVPQLEYYSERRITGIGRDETESVWEARVLPQHPKYLLLTRYEPHPAFMNDYTQRKNMPLVKTYGQPDGTVMAALFRFSDAVANG